MTEGDRVMRQLVYTMRFSGRATPVGPDGSVLAMVATAPGWTCISDVGSAGATSDVRCPESGDVSFTSELTLTGATSFQEVGTIAFGAGHRLRFATVGSGYLGPGPGPADRHGGALWRVEGGDGQFAGARGLITSNLLVGDDLAVIDHHLGVLFMP